MTTFFATNAKARPRANSGLELTGPSSLVAALYVPSEQRSVVATTQRDGFSVAAFGSAVMRVGAEKVLDEVFKAALGTGDQLITDADLVAVVVDNSDGRIISLTGTGVHRLFVHESSEGVTLGPHLAEIATSLGEGLAVDRSYEDMLLGFGFYPFGHTTFEGISATHPGSIVDHRSGEARGLGQEKVEIELSSDDPVESLYEMLTSTIARQAGDIDHHAVLMGGFDSALVASLLRKRGHKVSTFTFDFGSPKFNQGNVDTAVKALGLNHHWVPITPQNLGGALTEFAELMNQPSAQPHYQLHTALASRAVAEAGFDHVFTGDGCDAVFLGFPTISKRAKVQEILSKLPSGILSAAISALSVGPIDKTGGHAVRTARSALRSQLLPWPANAHLGTQYLDEVTISRLRNGAPPAQAMDLDEIRIKLSEGMESEPAIRIAFAGNGATGASRIKVDGAIMSTGVAQSSPFTDALVKGFASALPVEVLRPSGSDAGDLGKALLSEMTLRHDLLPAAVVNQPKQSPATSPVDEWYSGPLKPTILELCEALPFDYNKATVERLLTPNSVEDLYRSKVTLSQHVMQAAGILASYGAFTKLVPRG